MASYAIHMYQRPGVKPAVVGGPGCGLPLRNGLHPSYSPDTPFSFYSDVYSDYGDEQCLSSFEQLADADVLDGHLAPSTDDACARVLSIWEASWYGGGDPAVPDPSFPTHAWVHATRHLSTTAPRTDPPPPMPQSSQPYCPNFSPISGPLSSIDQHSSVLDPPPAASLPVPTDVRLQPSRLSTDSAVSNSSLADTGTWKQRQFIMSIPSSDTQEEPAPAGTLPSQIPTPREAAKATSAHTTADSEDDDDAMVAAAWRWRFTRRWKAEQARAVNPQLATSGTDAVADALLYLTAAGPPNAELSRTASEVSEGALRQSIGTGGTSGLLGADSFMHDSFSASSQPPLLAAADQQARASEQAAKVAKQAHNLLQQQRELERRVEQRAREQQVSWVGDLLDVVELDNWGKFRFVLLRVKDKQGRHKLILRGKNYAQEEVLASQCRQQVADLATQHHLQPASVELQGSGIVEWRRDRDRHLHLCCTQVYPCAGVSMAPKDLGRMAAILVKKHLPMHYQVAADGTYVA